MAKSKSEGGTIQPLPTARYNMRDRPASLTKPAKVKEPSRSTKRVYRRGNGRVSLLRTPQELVST
jgi:hypothetical protein